MLINHKEVCFVINGEQAVKMPYKGEELRFQNHHKQLLVLFVLYADFEEDKCMNVNQIMMNHTPKLIKIIRTVVMLIK